MMSKESHRIVCFTANRSYQSKICSTAHQSGYEILSIQGPKDHKLGWHSPEEHNSTAHLMSVDAALFDIITRRTPVLIIYDLDPVVNQWESWILALSVNPATRRIPIVGFGASKLPETGRKVRHSPARAIISYKNLIANFSTLIQQYAHIIDESIFKESCCQQLSNDAILGLKAFNQGEYFEAHEQLEIAWMADEPMGRDLYRALLQVAVAYYQVTRGNYRGAVKMFWRLRQWINPLPNLCRGINVEKVRTEASKVYKEVILLGPGKITQFDINFLQPVEFKSQFD